MKKFALAGILAIALGGTPAFAASPIFTWTGFYAGGQGGYAWMKNGISEAPDFPGITSSVKGPAFGGSAGYNWRASNWIAGAEGDWSWSDIKARTITGPTCGAGASCDEKDKWFGTARARLGMLTSPTLLLYGTGGFAWGREDAKFTNAVGVFDPWKTGTGWTAGGGAEMMLAPNWTAKLEYLYVDLGRVVFPASAVPAVAAAPQTFKFNAIRIGINYQFGSQ